MEQSNRSGLVDRGNTMSKQNKIEPPEPNKPPRPVDKYRFPVDALLREHGFEILIRPDNRTHTIIWIRRKDRRPFSQEDALELLDKNMVANAEEAQEQYWNRMFR